MVVVSTCKNMNVDMSEGCRHLCGGAKSHARVCRHVSMVDTGADRCTATRKAMRKKGHVYGHVHRRAGGRAGGRAGCARSPSEQEDPAYTVMAHIVTAHIVLAQIVMTHVVMAYRANGTTRPLPSNVKMILRTAHTL